MKTSLVFFALLLSPWQIAAFQLPRPRLRHVADIPEDDGGCTPTKLEQKKIGQVKKNMFVPGLFNPPRWVKRIQRIIARKNDNNDALFIGLDLIRSEAGTPMQRIVDVGKDIDFANKTQTVSGRNSKMKQILMKKIIHSLSERSCLLFCIYCAHMYLFLMPLRSCGLK